MSDKLTAAIYYGSLNAAESENYLYALDGQGRPIQATRSDCFFQEMFRTLPMMEIQYQDSPSP